MNLSRNYKLFRFLLLLPLAVAAAPQPPASSLNLNLQAPIKSWDQAIPFGNGAMGVLLWGEGNVLRLSLVRGDLWDERPSPAFLKVKEHFNYATLKRLVASNDMAQFNEIFDANYADNNPPTKLPAGRLEITLDSTHPVESFELNLATAEGVARLRGGSQVRALVSAGDVSHPVALAVITGAELQDAQLRVPDAVGVLGYAAARRGQSGRMRWFEQPAANGFSYAVCVGWKPTDEGTLLAVAVTTSHEAENPLSLAQSRVGAALKSGYKKLRVNHEKWWTDFWKHSEVTLPDPRILQQYYLDRYFYGSASRRGAPPIPLQGVWSADAGSLPPWKGDYHNDLNTQMTYIAYRTSGDFDQGACYLDFLWNLLPAFRKFATDFYGAPGAMVPGVMSLAGQPLGGWGQYSLSPSMGAWTAHLFYLHWRATGDAKFLRERAYPFCREIGSGVRALLQPDTNGVLKLPLSSSPEIFDNTRRAFLKPNSNYDLACLKMLFLALEEMARATGDAAASADWASTARQLGDFHTTPDGTLLLDETTPLPGSHRHLSNIIGIYPFNLITMDDGERPRQIIAASLRDWDGAGTSQWCGYSFSWMACLRARVGDAETAWRDLDIYTRAFTLRNGFHCNGDQSGSGYSSLTYSPVTQEGNYLAIQALHEILLQSSSADPVSNDLATILHYPANPSSWPNASFTDLRAEDDWRVSATRENNVTTWFRIVAGRDGLIRLRDNFAGRVPQWSRT